MTDARRPSQQKKRLRSFTRNFYLAWSFYYDKDCTTTTTLQLFYSLPNINSLFQIGTQNWTKLEVQVQFHKKILSKNVGFFFQKKRLFIFRTLYVCCLWFNEGLAAKTSGNFTIFRLWPQYNMPNRYMNERASVNHPRFGQKIYWHD